MFEYVQITVDKLPDKAPAIQFADKRGHVTNVKDSVHLLTDELSVVGNGKLVPTRHPAQNVLFGFVVENFHENLRKGGLVLD